MLGDTRHLRTTQSQVSLEDTVYSSDVNEMTAMVMTIVFIVHKRPQIYFQKNSFEKYHQTNIN